MEQFSINRTASKTFIILFLFTGVLSCKEHAQQKVKDITEFEGVNTFNFDDKQELLEYRELALDKTHPNLLNPEISKSEYKKVRKSWVDLHQRVGAYLSENNFEWEVDDSTIAIVHKLYFNSNGEIENYFFNILNENVSEIKKKEFAKLIMEFSKTNRIDFKQEQDFAQCGKTKYVNN
ncbi:hypothetical protein [Salegentibacter maritimus]|uniref:Uncharacterized protein n=1 Tax=Salegentibacter maritimus TaxID=2794347 RepID=A0ABS0TC32_9FLAO|nr:hypothetical protein [Salegentibacter maritimus]MBI6118595.1 hypothetical protein [Salegentibacter maritimus]